VNRIVLTLWKTTATAASFSVVTLIFFLSYFLRKTIANDRLLRQAESQNLQLSNQLHETQRELMNLEKLAVMGQLTASFAHEIGTPLNAIGGHLQLLREEYLDQNPQSQKKAQERLEIINGQLGKIEEIVKGFLQSTAKPSSQRQLVDLNQLVDKTLGIVAPRLDAGAVEVRKKLDRSMGPVRVVPVDLEQVFLNLFNNSLDSLRAKGEKGRSVVEVVTHSTQKEGKEWAEISVYDTGEGIRKADLTKVLKPFFTTKRPGEGTGLGLTICQQLVHKYGGLMEIESKEGAWTRVSIRLPYHS
jgi:signal transduction histidine kinase